ncbi:co-chaperone YbbN [Vibrio sp.]|nr:co-chaperone YbbN [Vibrio sp.]
MQNQTVIELNEQNFRPVLESSMQTPILIHFWAPSQPESSQVIPALKHLSEQGGGAFQLALLNCEQEQAIAMQFGVQALPTIALFINGQAVDGLGGPQTIDAISQMLIKHLPSQDEMNWKKIQHLYAEQAFQEALVILNTLPEEYLNQGDVKLIHASCLLETQQVSQAQEILNTIPLEYQQGDYHNLVAKLELHTQAANSPEIQSLEETLTQDPMNLSVAHDLAVQYHQVNRDEEALALLLPILQKEIGAHNGEIRKVFMDILSALGQGNALAGQYRRKLYSLLY